MKIPTRVRLCGYLLLIASLYSAIAQEQRKAKTPIPPETKQEMQALQKILAASPDDPAALFNLAMDYATIGDNTKALDLLEKMAKAHTGMNPKSPAGRPFKNIANDPRFISLIAQIEKQNPPVLRSATAFLIRERDLFPEGIAYDPVEETFYLSSGKRKIVTAHFDGSAKDFKSSGQDGLGETLGMKVDAKRRILWVVSDHFVPSGHSDRDRQGLFQYDLTTGALRFNTCSRRAQRVS